MNNLTGQTLGGYEIRAQLGVGGMGVVYRAYQPNLRREVALKVLHEEMVADAEAIERFTREAHTVAALEHPHIVPIYDYGSQNGITYVVMRLLGGGSLADRMAYREQTDAVLPAPFEVVEITQQLADALNYAHQKGVVHRDLKASNVMFSESGTAFLVDFGLARLSAMPTGDHLTQKGTVLGTPAYMAPEQWKSAQVGPAADQYALGVLVFALLTGHLPFDAPTPHEMLHKHLYVDPPEIQTLRADLPSALQPILERALEKEAAHRYPSVVEFARTLANSIQAAPAPPAKISNEVNEPSGFFFIQMPDKTLPSILNITPTMPPGFVPVELPVALAPTETSQPASRRKMPLLIGLVALLLIIFVGGIILLGQGDKDEKENAALQPTPLEGTPASRGEVLVVVADFRYLDEDLARVEENLESALRDAGVRFVRVHHEITERTQAQAVRARYQATLIMWGEVGRGGVRVYYETTPLVDAYIPNLDMAFREIESIEFSTENQDELEVYIFQGLDLRYVVQWVAGQAYYYANKMPEALAAFQAAAAALPTGREAELRVSDLYAFIAASLQGVGNFDEALIEANRAVELDPANVLAYRVRASILFGSGPSEAALNDYEQALLIDPNDATTYAARANALQVMGEFEAALTDWHTALRLAPENPAYYAQRGNLLSWQGREEEALADFQRAIEVDLNGSVGLQYRAMYYYSQQQLDLALADYTALLELDPTDPIRFRSRANVYIDRGEYALAVADYTSAIALEPDLAENYHLRATTYQKLGEIEAALADFDQYVELSSGSIYAMLNRADFKWQEGLIEAARQDYSLLIETYPNDEFAYQSRARFYEAIGEIENARRDLDMLITRFPDNTYHYVVRAEFFERQGDFAAAIADYSVAIEGLPDVPDNYLARGLLYATTESESGQDCDLARADLAAAQRLGSLSERLSVLESAINERCGE